MGNVQHQEVEPDSAGKKLGSHRFFLEIRDRDIVLDYRNKIKLIIGDVISFPAGGFEGLHLWDSNIILSRYILANKQLFTSKTVIELLSGTGIASITARKYTKASLITATDNNAQVTQNISKNIHKNGLTSDIQVSCIDWFEHHELKAKFNIVMGADLLFKGCPVELLLHSFNQLLSVGGKVVIVVPEKKGQDCSAQFISKIDHQIWSFKKEKLVDSIYMDSPLLNQVAGLQQFKIIADGVFHLYTLDKIKQKTSDKQFQLPKNLSFARKMSQRQNESKQKVQPTIQIKEQPFEKERDMKKQLQVVTINRNADVPEYQRNKRKTITDIIAESEEPKGISNEESAKSNQKQYEDQIEVVKKEHQLYDQPSKKSSSDQNQSKSNQQKMDELATIEDKQKITRMRKKSNPN